MTAHRAEATGPASNRVTLAGTVPRHPLVAEREVVFDRVLWVEHPEYLGNPFRHPPCLGVESCEADGSAHVRDVGVQRDDEFGRGDFRPEREVKVIPTHHPSKEEMGAFTGPTR